ncbi:type II toxin-antitoxin system Phd/YefM family antitoxin [Blastomonas sp.]|uniref:type II toxin-antitoxin system Phd/YefM family antitoxin n=1 Tax=Blastomonas sp. TaxID=1909299 RepID=UPI00359331D6
MLIVNIHDAKTRLSELIALAMKGEPFIISKAGKPMVRVEAIAPVDQALPKAEPEPDRSSDWGMGSLRGQFTVPDDFDTMAKDDIEAIFYGKP